MLKRLREAEQQQDFYSTLYRQYTTNLLKLVIYVRTLLANERVAEYLRARHPQQDAQNDAAGFGGGAHAVD